MLASIVTAQTLSLLFSVSAHHIIIHIFGDIPHHLFLPTYHAGSRGAWSTIPAFIGWVAGYCLDRSPAYHRHTDSFAVAFTPIKSCLSAVLHVFGFVGGNQRTWNINLHRRTQKGTSQDLCETAVFHLATLHICVKRKKEKRKCRPQRALDWFSADVRLHMSLCTWMNVYAPILYWELLIVPCPVKAHCHSCPCALRSQLTARMQSKDVHEWSRSVRSELLVTICLSSVGWLSTAGNAHIQPQPLPFGSSTGLLNNS